MAFIGEGSTTTPTSTQTTIPQTAPDYWKKMQEELKKQQALQAAQQAASIQAVLNRQNQANAIPGQLGGVTPNPNWLYNTTNSVSNWFEQLFGGYSNGINNSASAVNTALNNAGGWLDNLMNPNIPYTPANYNPAMAQYNAFMNRDRDQQTVVGPYPRLIHSIKYGGVIPKEQGINPNFWINAYTDTNTDDYGLPPLSTETPPPPPADNGYVEPEYPAWNFGGGGGGGRRSSSSVGRSKQLASWYQAMTNWNINRPQSG